MGVKLNQSVDRRAPLVAVASVGVLAGVQAVALADGPSLRGLGALAGGVAESVATGVSADGSVVVGTGYTTDGSTAFIWDSVNGMQDLLGILYDRGATGLDVWDLTTATGISADGHTVVGTGIAPSGRKEAWIAVLVGGCAADWDGNGTVNSQDLFTFLTAFQEGIADFNHSGHTDSQDFFEFIAAYQAGCP